MNDPLSRLSIDRTVPFLVQLNNDGTDMDSPNEPQVHHLARDEVVAMGSAKEGARGHVTVGVD